MLNSLRDGQINYGTTNYPSAHVPPHNVVAPIHQNTLIPTKPTTPVVYPWNSNPRFDHLYGFHSRYYNLDFPTPYPPATNQYVPPNMYGQNVSQCCQPCCRLKSQNIPKTSPPQALYNPTRPVQQLNRSYKSKKTLKPPCSEQFLPYIPNDLPIKYDTQNCYQQKYTGSYLNNTNYCPPNNNLWIPPAANSTWPTDRLRPVGRHSNVAPHDFSRDKNYQRLPNYQSNPYSNPTSTPHRPYNYIPPVPDVHDYRPSVYHSALKNNTPEYVPQEHNSRLPTSTQNNPSSSYLQQYYNSQPVQPYSDVQRLSEPFKPPPQVTSENSSKSNLNVREFLANWDEGEEEISEKSSETSAPIVVLDCMTVEGEALTKIQEKLNVVSYENLEKVLKENQNPLVINTDSSEIDSINNKAKQPQKPNFEPLDYTKRETGIIKPFINEKKILPESNGHSQSEKSYSVNFDGMVAWYGKKNTDISSTDLIERLADRIFNLSKSQENEGVSFGTAAYTGQITQTNRSIASSIKDPPKYVQNQQIFNLQHHAEKCIEPSVINKIDCNNDSIPRISSCVLNESNKTSTIKSNNINSSCIVKNITKKCLNVTNEESTSWNLDQGSQEQHLNMSLYDHSVIIKPLDFSSLTDETKGNPFVFEKNLPNVDKSSNNSDQFNKVMNENGNYNTTASQHNNQHPLQQLDSSNRNFPVIVSPNIHRQEYNGFHESVIQRTGCDKNKHDKVPPQPDFESMNWNISHDLDKIMKNTSMAMEQSCLYGRNNYNILDNMNSEKNVSAQWKDNVPCVDLTVNSKINSNHDSFFDGWNFIESYDNHSSKKINDSSTNNNEVHNQLFSNQMDSLEESSNKTNISGDKVEDGSNMKDVPFSKSNDMSSNNTRSRDVFNLNNRIPDFSDGFELPVINEPHEYMQFKKPFNDNEHRTDGSIFEHFAEPKCISRAANETSHVKIDQNKSDVVGLPNFKDKEPLAPMPMPPKLNVVKPILRDPSQMYTVIKQKLKYDNIPIDNGTAISDKTGHGLKDNQTNIFNVADLKSKYNSVQLNQFDVWSEKFVLKSDSDRSSSAVVQCDVEITQFKSTPENRNTLISKPNVGEHYQDKTTKLPENTNCDLTVNKVNVIENEKMNSNHFLNCLESTKTDEQKYRDTLDEFETSFGFDIHCNNESNKSFHEDIVDKCLEERINDQIGEHNISNTSDSNNISNSNTSSSNNTRLPFQCDFQSGYLIKNYFDENKNKAVAFDQKQTNNSEKSVTTGFNYHSEIMHNFELQNNKNINNTQNIEKTTDFNILNDINRNIKEIQNNNEDKDSNCINQEKSKHSFEPNHHGNTNISKTSNVEKNNFDYLSIEDRNFQFENGEKSILDLSNSKEIIGINNSTESNEIDKMNDIDSNIYKFSKFRKRFSVDFELNANNTNIFERNSTSKSTKNEIKTNKLENNKNSFESTFQSENLNNIEHHDKNIFHLGTNNSGIYQTQSLEKIPEFDFNSRIIQHFEMECSNGNVQKSADPKEIFTNENKLKDSYNYEVNNEENNLPTKMKEKPFSTVHQEPQISETSDLDCNDNIDLHNAMETENIDQENIIDRIFEGDCTAKEQEKLDSKTHCAYDVQNENVKENNHKKCNAHDDSILNNNAEVQNIFENVYDSFTTLNTENNGSNFSENCFHVDNKRDGPESLESIEENNPKIDDSEINIENCKQIKINETFEKPNDILLQEFASFTCSKILMVSELQNEDMEETKIKSLTPEDGNTKESNDHVLNKKGNFLDTPDETVAYENTATLEKQRNEDDKQSDVKLINQNNIQTIKNMTVDTVQRNVTMKTFENIKPDLLNTVENINKTQDRSNDHGNCSKLNLLHDDESTYQKYSNQIIEAKDSAKSEPNSLNHLELICQRYSSEVVEVGDSLSSGPSLLNHVEFTCEQQSNNTIKINQIEGSISSGSSSLNNVELSCQQHSNGIIEFDNSIDLEPSSSNHTELSCQENSNETVEVDESMSSKSSLLNDVDFTRPQQSNNVADNLTDLEPNSSNHTELSCQENSNETVEIDGSTSSKSNSINDVEFTCPQHSNNVVDNSTHFDPSYSHAYSRVELSCQEHSSEIDEAEEPIISKFNSLNCVEPTCEQYSNSTAKVDTSIDFEPSSLNHTELSHQEHSNEIVEAEESMNSESSSSNDVESISQQNSNNISESDNSNDFGPSPYNHADLPSQEHTYEVNEVEDSISPGLNSLNHVESTHQQNCNNVIGVEELTNTESDSLNYLESTRLQILSETIEYPSSVKSLEFHENNIIKTNDEPFIDNFARSESAERDIKLPRVKFILKCHNRNMMKKNIFDEESILPYKKSCVVKDEQVIARNIFKNRNKCYKPWNSIYRKESIDKPKEDVKDDVETEITTSVIHKCSIPQNTKLFGSDSEAEINEKVVSSEELELANQVQNDEKSISVENETIVNNSADSIVDEHPYEVLPCEELDTPVPSPFDDFQSETSTSEYCGSEEFWDKSLENEYKNVLSKTISKLSRNRVKIRDKFNNRLLARAVNAMKLRKRRRPRQRIDKTKHIDNNLGELTIDEVAASNGPPTAVLRWNATVAAVKTTNPRCKIKVQLPWGRIFNLNGHGTEDHQKTKDTKLELGPAKVEVRLSRTPGEWQVAACQSMVSPKSVVSVKRLVLQRATDPVKDYDEIFSSPPIGCDKMCSSPPLDCDEICIGPTRDFVGAICSSSSTKDFDVTSSSSRSNDFDDSCCSLSEDYDNNCSNTSKNNNSSSSSSSTGSQEDSFRKLPKIVIRRNGQNNNYTSYVSSNGSEGGDINDGTPQLMVRLVRDRKLDEMAADGITTIHLKHHVPIPESTTDTHGAKRFRYT